MWWTHYIVVAVILQSFFHPFHGLIYECLTFVWVSWSSRCFGGALSAALLLLFHWYICWAMSIDCTVADPISGFFGVLTDAVRNLECNSFYHVKGKHSSHLLEGTRPDEDHWATGGKSSTAATSKWLATIFTVSWLVTRSFYEKCMWKLYVEIRATIDLTISYN